MTSRQKEMIKARIRDLVKQGIDKELAKIMATAEIENGIHISSDGSIVY